MARKPDNRTWEQKNANRAPVWQPAEDDYKLIRDLAELGWPSAKIAEVLKITYQQFAGAIVRDPIVKMAYEFGVQNCKSFMERKLAWLPMPDDVIKTQELAADGLLPEEIAGQLKVSRQAFAQRMNDTPRLKEAYEQGNAEYRKFLNDECNSVLKNPQEFDKVRQATLIFRDKAYRGLTDKQDFRAQDKQPKSGNIKINVTLPAKVDNADMPKIAIQELERARKLRTEKQLPVVVDAEVQEVE